MLVCILDGWGVNVEDNFNAVFSAETPCTDALKANTQRYRAVKAHGTAVGLPSDADMGNSEVGHNALGSGQVRALLSMPAQRSGSVLVSRPHVTCCDVRANYIPRASLCAVVVLHSSNSYGVPLNQCSTVCAFQSQVAPGLYQLSGCCYQKEPRSSRSLLCLLRLMAQNFIYTRYILIYLVPTGSCCMLKYLCFCVCSIIFSFSS